MYKRRRPVRTLIRLTYLFLLAGIVLLSGALYVVLETKQAVYNQPTITPLEPFPVSLNLPAKRIEAADDTVEQYYEQTLASAPVTTTSWLARLTALLAPYDWYQQLASPVSRIFVIWPGQRKEEIVAHIASVLHWDDAQAAEFLALFTSMEPALPEGKFYPGSYVTHRAATPTDIATLINNQFVTEIANRYPSELAATFPLSDALTVAALIEREASDFTNMREVSGVIWNRSFIDMPLQLDATLQYAKASTRRTEDYWPVVKPDDKYIDSAYNTYQNTGLPPGPIANVDATAVLAALNPTITDCLYYFHAADATYYCSVTYEEHVAKLKARYGQGQ